MNQSSAHDRIHVAKSNLFMPAADPSHLPTTSFAEALVDPGGTFRDPTEVAEHPRFTREEKRAVLISWARDELMLEHVAKEALPELKPHSRIDAVVEALSHIDACAAAEYAKAAGAIRARRQERAFAGLKPSCA